MIVSVLSSTFVTDVGLDFVLVWEIRSRRKRCSKSRGQTEEEGEAAGNEEASRSERRKAQLAQWRDKFVQSLKAAGLLMEKVKHPIHHSFIML